LGGSDKAFLRLHGETIFERTLHVLRQCCSEVVVASNCPEKYARYQVEVAGDEYPSRGPLAGMHAALGRVSAPYAFVVACDMPFLRVEPIRYLQTRLGGSDAVVPWWDGDIEPLHAFYAASVRETIASTLRCGSAAVRDLLRAIAVTYVPEVEMRAVVGAEEAFCNVNTPEEAARYAIQI
jgi:molybdopterin-guanine dinucleotide biosynthesis protein A